MYLFYYIHSVQKFAISWRAKQKCCSLNKFQVQVQIGKVIFNSFTEVNVHNNSMYFIQKGAAIWENP